MSELLANLVLVVALMAAVLAMGILIYKVADDPGWAQQCSLNRPAVECIAEASEHGWK